MAVVRHQSLVLRPALLARGARLGDRLSDQELCVVTAPVKVHKHYDQNHNPQFLDNPDAINAGVATGSPIRLPYPGEAGQWNNAACSLRCASTFSHVATNYHSPRPAIAFAFSLALTRAVPFSRTLDVVTDHP
jgi:hypothetical protein